MALLPNVKGVLMDLFETLLSPGRIMPQLSLSRLYGALTEGGFDIPFEKFEESYNRVYEKYRRVRLEELREVSNNIWVAEALKTFGYQVEVDDKRVIGAVDRQFEAVIECVTPIDGALETLAKISKKYRVCLVSNFTYAPFARRLLQRHGFSGHIHAEAISHTVGFRKPHPQIFKVALENLSVEAGEALMIGDTPVDDIKGAKKMGIRSILVCKGREALEPLRSIEEEYLPDVIVDDIRDVCDLLGVP